jgi:hypothetical protein
MGKIMLTQLPSGSHLLSKYILTFPLRDFPLVNVINEGKDAHKIDGNIDFAHIEKIIAILF